MLDILLTNDGDIFVGEDGDIQLTESIRQAVKIRLLWFLGEWKYAPGFGLPYFGELLIKSPDVERVKRIVRDEALSVNGVDDIRNIVITMDKSSRTAKITFDLRVAETVYREELVVYG